MPCALLLSGRVADTGRALGCGVAVAPLYRGSMPGEGQGWGDFSIRVRVRVRVRVGVGVRVRVWVRVRVRVWVGFRVWVGLVSGPGGSG